MKFSILVTRGLKTLVFILSVLVPQIRNQDVCSKRGELCVKVKDCVNGKEMVSKYNYTSCSINFVPGICCKNAIKPPVPPSAPPTRKGPVTSNQSPPSATPPQSQPTPSSTQRQSTPSPPPIKQPTPTPPTQQTTQAQRITSPPVKKSRNSTAVALENCGKYAQYKYVERWKDPDLPGQPRQKYFEADCAVSATLIINGKPAEPKEYPHMALLGYGTNFQDVEWNCGGSLISENFILSAAHCSKSSAYGVPKWALLGDLDIKLSTDDAMPVVYSIIRAYDHPSYDKKTTTYDITLFELNTTVKLSPYVRPACLYTSKILPLGTRGSITGWGLTGPVSQRSNHLLKATIETTADWRCTGRFEDYNTTTMICAGDLAEGQDTCLGDSGGPLQLINEKESCVWDVIGVTSYGAGLCGNQEDPSVFTNVAFFLDWIQNIVWP